MFNEHLARAVANDDSLDERRNEIFRTAFSLVCKDEHLVLRESGNDGSHAVFDRDRGEMRILLDMTRHSDGDVAETLDLKIIEMECMVFHVAAQRLRLDGGRNRVVVNLYRYTSSYWEVILKHIPL